MCYQGGQGKGGRQQIQEVARYPSLMSQSTSHQYCGPSYPSLILPCNRVHLKLGGCNTRPGKVLRILTLPADLPLALTFAHCLSETVAASSPQNEHYHSMVSALSICLESLTKFLNRIDCLIPLKELVFHQLSCIMWTLTSIVYPSSPDVPSETSPKTPPEISASDTLHETSMTSPETSSESPPEASKTPTCPDVSKTPPELVSPLASSEGSLESSSEASPGRAAEGEGGTKLYTFTTQFIQATQQELLKLYEAESSEFSKAKSADSKYLFPAPESIGGGGLGRYSTYFQALLEFVLAMMEYQYKCQGCEASTSISSSTVSVVGSSSTSTTSSSFQAPTPDDSSSSSLQSTSTSSSCRSEVMSGTTSALGAAPVVATPSSDSVSAKKSTKRTRSRKVLLKREVSESAPKKEKWLSVVRHAASFLRGVVLSQFRPPCDAPPTPSSKGFGFLSSRLIVITGISSNVSCRALETAIRRVCKLYGGLYQDMLYLPITGAVTLPQHQGHAVIELCCANHTSSVSSALLAAPSLHIDSATLQAMAVNESFSCGEEEAEGNTALVGYLRSRLMDGEKMSSAASLVLSEIFTSSCLEPESPAISLSQVSGTLCKLLSSVARVSGVSLEVFTEGVWRDYGGESNDMLSLDSFIRCIEQGFSVSNAVFVRGVWLGLIECGYDLHLERYAFAQYKNNNGGRRWNIIGSNVKISTVLFQVHVCCST